MPYLVLLFTLLGAVWCQLTPTAFSSDSDACASPFTTDCLALRARLRDADNSNNTFQILHDTFTPINSYADCALSVLWPQNIGEGWLNPTYSDASDALDSLMEYGYQDGIISGVLGRTDMGSDQQPIYWLLSGSYNSNDDWQAGFQACQSAVSSNMTEDPGTSEDTPVVVSTSLTLDRRSELSARYHEDYNNELSRRQGVAPNPLPNCQRIYNNNFGSNEHFRCYCEGRQYDIHCTQVGSAQWTETNRQQSISALFAQVNAMWLANTLQPGGWVSSSPKGASLYTGASGNTDQWRVPNDSGNRCCNWLLLEQCQPTFGRQSIDGMCEPSWTHDYMFSFNQNFYSNPFGSTGPTVGREPGGL